MDESIALEFVNSARGREQRTSSTPVALAAWLDAHLVEPAGHGATAATLSLPARRQLFEEGRRLREALNEILEAFSRERPLPPVAVGTLDRVLQAGTWMRSIVAHGASLTVREEVVASAQPLGRLAPLAADAVALLSTVAPDRLRSCAAEDCGRWFVDTSRGGQRRWCSMATCGNRAKAARWRARHGDDG